MTGDRYRQTMANQSGSDYSSSCSDEECACTNPAKAFNWICYFCENCAKDPIKVETQWSGAESVALVDSDGCIWIRCDNCFVTFHLKCVTKDFLPSHVHVTPEEINSKGRFECCPKQIK